MPKRPSDSAATTPTLGHGSAGHEPATTSAKRNQKMGHFQWEVAGATGLETETLGHQGELRGKKQVFCGVGFPSIPLNTPEYP